METDIKDALWELVLDLESEAGQLALLHPDEHLAASMADITAKRLRKILGEVQ